MKEKVSFYLLFVILIILEIALINFAFPFFISITLENGICLLLSTSTSNVDLVIGIVNHIAVLWFIIGASLAIIVLLICQFFIHRGFEKIGYWGRIIAIYSSVIIIFFFILIFFFSSAAHSETGGYYSVANFFIKGFIH